MNLAYINSLKNKNKDARIEIELKNENTFILHPKRMDRKLLKSISSVCRVDSKYEILISKVSELETLNVELAPPKAVMKELESSLSLSLMKSSNKLNCIKQCSTIKKKVLRR